jgi:hypothetical protein
VVWIVAVLLLDRSAALWQQHLLGLGTWLVLLAVLRVQDRATRVQVAVVVAFATVVELVFAGWLGVYVYRLDNVPAFVPPGPRAGLPRGAVDRPQRLGARARPGAARARRWSSAAPGRCGASRWRTGPDALGAFWYGCLLLFAWRGRSPLLYAGAFLVVSGLELLGTSLGTWTWGTVDPVTGWISIGNPPERHRRRLRLVRRRGAVRHPPAAPPLDPPPRCPSRRSPVRLVGPCGRRTGRQAVGPPAAPCRAVRTSAGRLDVGSARQGEGPGALSGGTDVRGAVWHVGSARQGEVRAACRVVRTSAGPPGRRQRPTRRGPGGLSGRTDVRGDVQEVV